MKFIKDISKVLGIILGITLFFMLLGLLFGAESGADKTKYFLYQHEVADDYNELNNAPWYDTNVKMRNN